MLVPAEEKKLLNALAISVLSVVSFPLVQISVTLCVFFLRLAASFKISQDFLSFCWLLVLVRSIVLCVS